MGACSGTGSRPDRKDAGVQITGADDAADASDIIARRFDAQEALGIQMGGTGSECITGGTG